MTEDTVSQFEIPELPASYTGGLTPTQALNARFGLVEDALNTLAAQITLTGNKHAIVQQNVPIASGATLGDLVYWDTENGVYAAAQALLRNIPGVQGDSIEAPQARVEGILLNIDSGANTGTLLCGGCYTDTAVASGFFGTDAPGDDYPPGVYYLSPTTAGKVTGNPGSNLRQPVLVYHGNGSFNLNLFYMAHDNHFHASEIIDTWSGAAGAYTATMSGGWGEATAETAAVFLSGGLATEDFSFGEYVSGAQVLTYSGATQPASGSVVVFNHYPFAYGAPVVRVIKSTDNNLSVNTANGIVTLTAHDFTSAGSASIGSAIATIQGGTYTTTPVVTKIIEGAGITVGSANAAGEVTVQRSDMYGTLLEPDTINHNGTTVGSVDGYQYVMFPKGRTGASLCIQKTLVNVPASATLNVVATLFGSGGTSGGVTLKFVDNPTADATTTTLPTSGAIVSTTINMNAGAENTLTYISAETGKPLAAADAAYRTGTAVAIISATTAPTIDTKCLHIGFILQDPNQVQQGQTESE